MIEVLGLGNKRKRQIKRVVRRRKGVADSEDVKIENKTCVADVAWTFFPLSHSQGYEKKRLTLFFIEFINALLLGLH